MSEQNSSARNSMWVLITRIIVTLMAVASSVIVARVLGDHLRGYYGALLLFGVLWLPIASLGFGGSTVYLLSNRRYRPNDILITMIIQGFAQGLIVTLLFTALRQFQLLGKATNEIEWSVFLPIVSILPLQGIVALGSRFFLGDSRFKLSNLFTILAALIPLILQVVIVTLHPEWIKPKVGEYEVTRLHLVLQAHVASQIILALIMFAVLFWKYRPTRFWNQEYMAECWSYGLMVWWGDITTRLNLRGDQYIFFLFLDDSTMWQLGQYQIAATMSEMLWMLPDSLNTILFNRIAGSKDNSERAALTERVHRLMFWTMAALIFVVAMAAPVMLWILYGEKFSLAKWPFWFLLPGTLFLTTTKAITKYLSGSGKPGLSSLTTLVGTVFGLGSCVVALWVLPSEWAMTGVAGATSFGYLCTAIYSIYLYRQQITPLKPRLFRLIPADWKWFKNQAASLK